MTIKEKTKKKRNDIDPVSIAVSKLTGTGERLGGKADYATNYTYRNTEKLDDRRTNYGTVARNTIGRNKKKR